MKSPLRLHSTDPSAMNGSYCPPKCSNRSRTRAQRRSSAPSGSRPPSSTAGPATCSYQGARRLCSCSNSWTVPWSVRLGRRTESCSARATKMFTGVSSQTQGRDSSCARFSSRSTTPPPVARMRGSEPSFSTSRRTSCSWSRNPSNPTCASKAPAELNPVRLASYASRSKNSQPNRLARAWPRVVLPTQRKPTNTRTGVLIPCPGPERLQKRPATERHPPRGW